MSMSKAPLCDAAGLFIFTFSDEKMIIPCRVTQRAIHEELRQLFDRLVAQRVIHHVMIAERDQDQAEDEKSKVKPG